MDLDDIFDAIVKTKGNKPSGKDKKTGSTSTSTTQSSSKPKPKFSMI